jgi:hypothetical protein
MSRPTVLSPATRDMILGLARQHPSAGPTELTRLADEAGIIGAYRYRVIAVLRAEKNREAERRRRAWIAKRRAETWPPR